MNSDLTPVPADAARPVPPGGGARPALAARAQPLPAPRRGQGWLQRLGRGIVPYLFVAPAGIFIAVVFVYPVIDLVYRSTHAPAASGEAWVGLHNFRLALSDPIFWQSITNNGRLFLAVPILAAGSVILASILYDQIRFWRFYRTVVFMPYVLATPVVGIVFTYILQQRGVFNEMLRAVGLGAWTRDWLGTTETAIWVIMAVIIWKEIGFGVILMLARLMSVPEELYDAARTDGASWWQTLRHITLPQLSTVLEFYITISFITMLSWVFNYVYVMTKGGPANSTYVMEYFIYWKAFQYSQLHIAAAMSLILLVMAGALAWLQSLSRRRLEGLE